MSARRGTKDGPPRTQPLKGMLKGELKLAGSRGAGGGPEEGRGRGGAGGGTGCGKAQHPAEGAGRKRPCASWAVWLRR